MNVVALAKAIAEHRGVRHEPLLRMVQSGVVRCAELELTGYRFSSELQPEGDIGLYQEVFVVEAVSDAKAEITAMEASLVGLDEVRAGDELVFRVLHEDESWDRQFLKDYESLRPLRHRSIAQPVAAFLSEGNLRRYLSETLITTPLGEDALWTRKDKIVADFNAGGLGAHQTELDYVLGELLLAAASLEAVEDRVLRLENLLTRLDNAELDLGAARVAVRRPGRRCCRRERTPPARGQVPHRVKVQHVAPRDCQVQYDETDLDFRAAAVGRGRAVSAARAHRGQQCDGVGAAYRRLGPADGTVWMSYS